MKIKEFFKKKKSSIYIFSAGVICFVLSLWVLNHYILDRPSFCIRCHLIQDANTYWQTSRHKPEYTKNSCNVCHIQPGLIGSIKGTIYGMENLYVFFFGQDEDDVKASRPVYCSQTRCHPNMEKSMIGKKVKVNHGLHMEMGYACAICHDRVAHEEFGMVSNLSMMKDFCFRCHNDEVAPRQTCGICHVYQDRMLKGIDTPEGTPWIQSMHLQRGEVVCQNCHTRPDAPPEETCLNCHQQDTVDLYQQQKADFAKRLDGAKSQITEVESLFGRLNLTDDQKSEPGWVQILARFKAAQQSYTYLIKDNSEGAHNEKLAATMLTTLESDIQRVRYTLYTYLKY